MKSDAAAAPAEGPADETSAGAVPWRENYVSFAISRVLSAIASQGIAISLGWLVYDKTHSAFYLGLIGLCQFLPMVVLTLVVGQVADRFDRRRIALAAQIVKAIVAIGLSWSIWSGTLGVPMIFLAVVILGAAQSFEQPTMQSLVPSIVPPSALQQALSVTTALTQTATIVGPAVGGVVYGINPLAPFVLAAVLFVLASVCVKSIKTVRGGNNRGPVTLGSAFAGVSFIFDRPVMLGVISLDLFAVLLGGTTALLPIFARDILQAGPWALGLLRSASSVGAVLMSLFITRVPLKTAIGLKMLGAVAVFGLATIVFALSTNIVLSIIALAVLGAADTISMVVRITLVQLLTPDEMRGRVNAVNSLFVGTSNQLGEFYSGTLAGFVGPVASGVIGGVSTLVVVAMWLRLFPDLRKVKTLAG
ncbi:MFS transporter [Pigmentiphaga soli]|uniref:Multidrug efflux pump Tap n=1 Tax=Pigmentiphaga soli TaxID=1007095 RepID=A0ABP8HIF8_9BURK